jgi:hypothetical protein
MNLLPGVIFAVCLPPPVPAQRAPRYLSVFTIVKFSADACLGFYTNRSVQCSAVQCSAVY